ncbi:MAG: hypothetical protein OXU45_05565, partial [Candidatus Melainabacteria bacterium]|nr:hypothetical protein [Candidatus Melainabacteria bacterium]
MPINANQLAGSYQEGRRCIKRVCDCLLGDVRDWDGDELELENNGTTLRFYRRRSSGHPTAVVNIHDRDKVGKFLGLEAAYPPLDDDNEFALNPRNLLKIYRGHPSTIQELCNENFGNLSSWDTGVRVVGNDELNIEVFRRNDLGGPTAAVKKTDLNKFAHLFELNRRYRLLNDEAEFGFYAENLFMHYTNHAQLRDLCDRIVGDIDLWDSDVRDITYEGVTCRFYRRQVATGQAVAAIKKSDLTKLEELYQLNKLYPLIDDKETPVNRNQLKMRYR